LSGPALTKGAAPSCSGEEPAECGENGGASCRSKQGRELPYPAALIRDASSGKRIRYPDGAGTVRAQGCEHDDDLYARLEYAGDRGVRSPLDLTSREQGAGS